MRRLVALTVGVLLLVSCAPHLRRPQLSPEEVLRKAAQAGQELDSASYSASGNFSLSDAMLPALSELPLDAKGTATVDGRLQHQGTQSQFSVDMKAAVDRGDGSTDLTTTFDVVMADEQEVYLRIRELSSSPPGLFLPQQVLSALLGAWWSLPKHGGSGSNVSITPDPRLLRTLAEVVTVEHDDGIVELRDHDVYHYDVKLDTAKLLGFLEHVSRESGQTFDASAARAAIGDLVASGELWIDADDFTLHAIRWDLMNLPMEGGGTLTATFRVDLRDHNAAVPIELPRDAKPFTLEPALTPYPSPNTVERVQGSGTVLSNP